MKIEAAERLLAAHPFMDLSPEEKQEFLFELPSLLEGWFYGAAMGVSFQVEGAATLKWATHAFRKFLDWAVFFSEILPHKEQKLYRLVSIPYTEKNTFKLQAGKNALHSWTTDIDAARYLYKLAYKGRHKKSAAWSYLIVTTFMPASRQAIDWKQTVKLAQWVIKNSSKLYATSPVRNSLYSEKNMNIVWNSLLKRLNSKLIREQHEVICIGKKPLVVNVVERLQ